METKSTQGPRKRGAPKGNRNAWKHGRRSASAKGQRDASRAEILDRLPDPDGIFPPGIRSFASLIAAAANIAPLASNNSNNSVAVARESAGNDEDVHLPTNKTNNSVWRVNGEGDPPPHFSTNKPNNSAAGKRGAPKGNTNAVKHGGRSAKRHAYGRELRRFLADIRLSVALAHASACQRELERRCRGRLA